jgi:ABC-type nitrate/sulfonate/bicarbonate transport system ATPase subunit
VTHDIDEALRIADRVMLLGNGGSLMLEIQVNLSAPRGVHIPAVNAQRLHILQVLHDATRAGSRSTALS